MIEISTMMPTVQGIETCRPHLPILFRTTLIPRSNVLQLVMTVILGSKYVLRSYTGIKDQKNLGYDKTFTTLCSTV